MNWILENKKLIAAAAVVVLAFLSGWTTRSWYEDSVALKIEQVKTAVTEITAGQISGIRVENKTVYAKTVEKLTHEVQYRECVADAEMMELTNKARGF